MNIYIIPHRDLIQCHVFQKPFITLREWGVCFYDDALVLAEVYGVFIEVQWVHLDLVHDWLQIWELH